VTARGNARQVIFVDDEDRERFLSVLAWVVDRFKWLCHAYCLMDNHYHLLIETPEPNLSAGMRQLNGVYTQHHNRRHARVGHLFEGRYKAIIVEKDSYLLELCRYIALNPVRAGARKTAGQWKWSGYRATAGTAQVPDFLTVEWTLSQFGRDKRGARDRYRRFVAEGAKRESPWENLKGQIFLGTEEFVSRLRELLEGKEKVKEAPRAQRYATRPTLEKLLPQNALVAGPARDEAVWQAHCEYGYRLREIGDHIGAHYSTISRAVKRIEQQRMLQCKT
jgi:REP element-mobilizing transposase RayT